MKSVARAWILGSALVVVGCEDKSEQCIVTTVGYEGSADGPVYVVGKPADGSGITAGKDPSIAVAQATASEDCSEGEVSKGEWTFQAWIDVTGSAEERCAGLFGPHNHGGDAGETADVDDCAPLPDDPQVTITRTLGEGRSRIQLEIEDR
jgi:hypothetical protein